MARETPQHLLLKRLAFVWAWQHGYTIAAAEVSVPRLGCARVDVAAFQPIRKRGAEALPMGATAIFECKQSRADFLQDAGSEEEFRERLAKLAERRALYEEALRRQFPTLRRGEELFPEFDSYRYEDADYRPYRALRAEIEQLSEHLYGRTKFARLARWRAANLHYLVAEPGVVRAAELPLGWGLLLRADEETLDLSHPATWHEAAEAHRYDLLLRIGQCGTRAVHRAYGVGLRPGGVKKEEAV